MARLRDVVFDCAHPAALARFWAAALDGYEVESYDEAALAHLRSIGVTDPEDDPTVLVNGPEGEPRLWCQRVPEPKTAKSRVHLDLVADDVDAELVRLQALGATPADEQPNDGLIVLHDPAGNEFCLLR